LFCKWIYFIYEFFISLWKTMIKTSVYRFHLKRF
jgi:hypothetical protein